MVYLGSPFVAYTLASILRASELSSMYICFILQNLYTIHNISADQDNIKAIIDSIAFACRVVGYIMIGFISPLASMGFTMGESEKT